MLARLMADGRYHYRLASSPGPGPGPLLQILIDGTDDVPSFAETSATPAEHEEWIGLLRRSGFEVRVVDVDEATFRPPGPRSAR